MKFNIFYSAGASCPQSVSRPTKSVFIDRQKWRQLACVLICSIFLMGAQVAFAHYPVKIHEIELWAEKIPAGAEGGNDMFAYRMARHIIKRDRREIDVTHRYVAEPTVPGPTIVIDEGDEVMLTLKHAFDPGDSTTLDQVSVHVHGVHYDILSDGTIEYINLVADESATPAKSYTYHWIAAPGTAGTWAYHDHNMITLNGAEDRGLYGALIVNDRRARLQVPDRAGIIKNVPISRIKKEYVLFIGDDAFWGTEINNRTHQQTPLWNNPTLSAQRGQKVRFHLIALGTNTHNFKLDDYGWVDPGTNLIITEKVLGPLEKHVFTVEARQSSQYWDDTFTSNALAMKGVINAVSYAADDDNNEDNNAR